MEKIRVFTAFSGYDSQCLALDKLGVNYDLVGWSEIDKYAIKAHDLLFPQYKDRNYGDISKIDWSKVPDFDLFTYSSPCFVGDTMVLTNKGYKKISEIKIGDEVLTHDNTFKKVLLVGSDGEKPIYEVKSMGALPILCTNNHPFWVRRKNTIWDNSNRKYKNEFTNPYKSRVNEFVGGEYLGIPIFPTFYDVKYSDEILWIVGRYIADGHITKNGEVILSIGSKKIEEFDKIKTNFRKYKHGKSCYRIVFNRNTEVFNAIKELTNCEKSLNKDFSVNCLGLTKERLKNVLEGYMSGDGCYIKKSNTFQATTISKNLANSLVLMIQKVYNVGVKIYYTKREKKHIIEGREVNQHDTYMIRYNLKNIKKQWFFDNNHIWYPIKKVENKNRKEKIYNITVEDNHTYTANNIVCFNCQDFSQAGMQRGGEEGSNTRSSLIWECRKAILAKKPKYLLLENVEALVSKKFINLFNKWIAELGEYGYTSYWQVLNGKNYGIPHNRSRVFLVSILRDENEKYPVYNFPKPFPLEKKLKDILEPIVDNKFFLKRENINKVLYKENKKSSDDKEVLEPLKIIEATKKGYAEACVGDSIDICRLSCHSRRGRVGKGVANTLTCSCDMGTVIKCEYKENNAIKYEYRVRKLTPKECFRLMGLNEESIKKIQESNQISDVQQYKLAGNSIIVDVLENIFKKLFVDKDNDYGYNALF